MGPSEGEDTALRQAREQDTAWRGETARWYDTLVGERGSEYHREVVFPGTVRLLGLKEGERVLDLACGPGAFTRTLPKLGVSVVGLDASEELIAVARQKAEGKVRYEVGDAARLGNLFPPDSFDAIACILSIQNIDPLEAALAGCATVLRPGGRLVLVMTHPCFRVPRQSGWGWDEARKLLYRRVDHYLSPLKVPIQTHPGTAPHVVTWSFHRPLQAYVQGLAQAGLWVNAMEEWPSHKLSQPGARARAENRARDEVPLFLALRAVKVERPQDAPPVSQAPQQKAAQPAQRPAHQPPPRPRPAKTTPTGGRQRGYNRRTRR